MIDFHCHVLPRIDDGSKSVSESLAMLRSLAKQGVDTVVATPHFYANRESVDEFISRRDKSAEALHSESKNGLPRVLSAAEVSYYPGIGRLEGLRSLCVEGSNLLLLEMPMAKWTEYTVSELASLANRGEITVVIAHLDRYMSYQSKYTIRRLLESGILMQFNADFFTRFLTRRKAIAMLRRGEIHLLGSDCHNMTSRPPEIGNAIGVIKKKLGDEFAARFAEYGCRLLKQK